MPLVLGLISESIRAWGMSSAQDGHRAREPSDANPMDFLTEARRCTELRLQDTETARVTDRGDRLRASQIRSHRCGDNGIFDPQHVAARGLHCRIRRFRGDEVDGGGSRAHRFTSWALRCGAGKFVSNCLLIAITFSPVKPSQAARSAIA